MKDNIKDVWVDKCLFWSWEGKTSPTTPPPTKKVLLRVPKRLFGCALCIGVIEPKKYTKVNRRDSYLVFSPIRSRIILPFLDFYGFFCAWRLKK